MQHGKGQIARRSPVAAVLWEMAEIGRALREAQQKDGAEAANRTAPSSDETSSDENAHPHYSA